MTSTADLTPEEREIYDIEYRSCGMRTHAECAAQADATITRARQAFGADVHKHGCCGGSTAKQRPGYAHIQAIPTNAPELVAAVIREACTWAQLAEDAFYKPRGASARQWAVVALSNAPAVGHGLVNILGPGRASDMLRLAKHNACYMADSLRKRAPLAHDAALKFGGELRLEWAP
jgi:hypothetical protein